MHLGTQPLSYLFIYYLLLLFFFLFFRLFIVSTYCTFISLYSSSCSFFVFSHYFWWIIRFLITFWNAQDLDLLFHSPQVMNKTTNIRTIRFSWHKSLDLCFHEENRITLREMTFCFFRRKIIISCLFSRNKRKCILHFHFQKEKRKHILSLVFQGEKRKTSHQLRERDNKKTFYFYFF